MTSENLDPEIAKTLRSYLSSFQSALDMRYREEYLDQKSYIYLTSMTSAMAYMLDALSRWENYIKKSTDVSIMEYPFKSDDLTPPSEFL